MAHSPRLRESSPRAHAVANGAAGPLHRDDSSPSPLDTVRRLWMELDPGHGPPEQVEAWRDRPHAKSHLYRLSLGPRASVPSVFAKVGPSPAIEPERVVYEELLPGWDASAPRYFGSRRSGDRMWLFVEDVGRRRIDAGDPHERRLASLWIARLHVFAATRAPFSPLPGAGAARYLSHLGAGRQGLLAGLRNPLITGRDREMLLALLDRLEIVEAIWDRIERACRAFPSTVVHGDFRPKNVLVRPQSTGLRLDPIDWELTGWGPPCADLAPSRGPDRDGWIDREVYRSAVKAVWPGLGRVELEHGAELGMLFRDLAAVDWQARELVRPHPDYLFRPLSHLRHHEKELTVAMARLARWVS